ncbi:(2Fe-2S) ferredoxin domain-containing protein [Micromonospora aurantiaca (nom. illeg.)]|uniref:(2Fe-2S) ferredoxin domain-containing protein n=1 Tax=Micromonospora aurantiaca (nom. illeg.) TaxID=47850 RepID=UPI0002F5DA74|nr:(2Fe-2S) ferredoxin domain-containing protein [Micromonospora aurantiaca]
MSIPTFRDADVTVVYCDGHRCRALRHRGRPGEADGESEDLADVLRQAVRSSQGGVLIRAECLGACHRAPAVLLLSGTEPAGRRGILFGPIEDPQHMDEVVELIRHPDRPHP